jgi:hypothetical protein
LIDLRESFDQVDRVTFITGQLRSDGVRVDCDVHDWIRVRTRNGSDGILRAS